MSSEQKLDIFISYPWKIKPHVDELCAFLVFNQYKVWMDCNVLNAGSFLSEEIHKAILEAKVFICCINRDYLSSVMCNKEIQYAFDLGKTIIPIMFEEMSTEKLGRVGFIISGQLQIRVYDNPNDWNGESGHKLMNSLNKILSLSSAEATKEEPIKKERSLSKTVQLQEASRDTSYSSLPKPQKPPAQIQQQPDFYGYSDATRDTSYSSLPNARKQPAIRSQQALNGYSETTSDSENSLPTLVNQNTPTTNLNSVDSNLIMEQKWYNYNSYAADMDSSPNLNVSSSQYRQNQTNLKQHATTSYNGYDVNSYSQPRHSNYFVQPASNVTFSPTSNAQPQQPIGTNNQANFYQYPNQNPTSNAHPQQPIGTNNQAYYYQYPNQNQFSYSQQNSTDKPKSKWYSDAAIIGAFKKHLQFK